MCICVCVHDADTNASVPAPAVLTNNSARQVYSATVPGLRDGATYNLVVYAVNDAGRHSRGCVDQATSGQCQYTFVPCGPPDAPRVVAVSASRSAVTMAWAAAWSGGCDITNYTLWLWDTEVNTTTVVTVPSASTLHSWTGLPPGATYRTAVAASTAVATGQRSVWSAVVTTCDVPGQPMNVTASGGDRAVAVTWLPSGDGGCAVANYSVVLRDVALPNVSVAAVTKYAQVCRRACSDRLAVPPMCDAAC